MVDVPQRFRIFILRTRRIPRAVREKSTLRYLDIGTHPFASAGSVKKFAQWLQTETSGVFKAWRRKSIQVEFASFGSIQVKRPEKGRLLASVLVGISPRGKNGDINDLGCEVGLDFVTAEGRINIFPFKLSVSIHCGKEC